MLVQQGDRRQHHRGGEILRQQSNIEIDVHGMPLGRAMPAKATPPARRTTTRSPPTDFAR